MSVDILDFSFNCVMEYHNSSLLVHLPTFVGTMPVTPKKWHLCYSVCVLALEMYIYICMPRANTNQRRTHMSETGWRHC